MAFGRKAKDTVSTTGEYLRATNEVSRPMAAVMVLFMVLAIAAIGFTLFAVGKWTYDRYFADNQPTAVEQTPADQPQDQNTQQGNNDQQTQGTQPAPTTPQNGSASTGTATPSPSPTTPPANNSQTANNGNAANSTVSNGSSTANTGSTQTTPVTGPIPNTGPEHLLALFIGSSVLGTLGYRAYALQRTKR